MISGALDCAARLLLNVNSLICYILCRLYNVIIQQGSFEYMILNLLTKGTCYLKCAVYLFVTIIKSFPYQCQTSVPGTGKIKKFE